MLLRPVVEMSADIYRLIVREIPDLRDDKRVLELLEASIAGNVATMLHILQHGIDLEKEFGKTMAELDGAIAANLKTNEVFPL